VTPQIFQRAPKFGAHNFELQRGRWTLPGAPKIGEEPISSSYLRTMQQFCPPPARVADLGCLEGGYSVMLARAGYEVVGIEGQPDNFATCEWVADRVGLANLSFVEDDVRSLRDHGRFDAVLCAGLLYHLDHPVEFLSTLGDVTGRLLIVSANHATLEGSELEVYAPLLAAELTEHEGRLGRWFGEQPGPWSSLGNSQSFWLERRELLRALVESGFPTVFEQFDWLADEEATRRLEDRKVSIFVAVKPPPQAAAAARNLS
jgi:SAM-dependent methyltransferase